MSSDIFQLTQDDQADLIKIAEQKLGLADTIIEKDLWLCKLLDIVFAMPYNMVFRGGTSLSKAYGLINRFSEDVDITIDYRQFKDPLDLNSLSRSQLKRVSAELKSALSDFVKTHIYTYIKEHIENEMPNLKFKMTISDDGEQFRFFYPSVLTRNVEYLRDHILLEFGIRNEIDPQERINIKPYLSDLLLNDYGFPLPTVETLSPVRTFWEKCTLMHVECHRDKLQQSPDRLSRHWYDIYKLNQSWVGPTALQSKHILERVITHKKAFFNASYAHYDDCLDKNFRIVPDTHSLNSLEKDYKQMRQAGMFIDMPPDFFELINGLHELESQLNE